MAVCGGVTSSTSATGEQAGGKLCSPPPLAGGSPGKVVGRHRLQGISHLPTSSLPTAPIDCFSRPHRWLTPVHITLQNVRSTLQTQFQKIQLGMSQYLHVYLKYFYLPFDQMVSQSSLWTIVLNNNKYPHPPQNSDKYEVEHSGGRAPETTELRAWEPPGPFSPDLSTSVPGGATPKKVLPRGPAPSLPELGHQEQGLCCRL